MILLVDAGNSRLKWSYLIDGKRSEQFAQDYLLVDANTILSHLLEQANAQEKPIKQLVVVSVLQNGFIQSIQRTCEKLMVNLHFISAQAEAYGVLNGYDDPSKLGADRFVGIIAAHHLLPQRHCIVISCGTAVTIDAITATGKHLGGLILPGLRSFSDHLIKKAALLSTPKSPQTKLFASNTADAIASGSMYGLVEAINGISLRMKTELGILNTVDGQNTTTPSVQTILCGGDAQTIHTYLSTTQREDDWMMQGLQVIAEYNTKNKGAE